MVMEVGWPAGGLGAVRRKITSLAIILALSMGTLTTLGAGPKQDGVPPQPFRPDFFSGQVSIQDEPAAAGTLLVGCVDDCDTVFESDPVQVGEGGSYRNLLVNPTDRELVGRTVSFYLVNEFGRVRAAETKRFEGGFNLYILNLTVNEPLPTSPPTPTPIPTATPLPPLPPPALPIPGDTTVTTLPRLALISGAAALLGGIFLLLLARRRQVL